jgi:peptide chain release factor 1
MAKELLFSVTKKDFDLHWFSGTGAGGQGRNKLQNSLRLIHRPSGASATGQSNKSRVANQKEAFKGVIEHPKFKMWYNQKVMECLSNETLEEKVKKQMAPKNIKVEGKDEKGRWKELSMA